MPDTPEQHSSTLSQPLAKICMINDLTLGAEVADLFILASAQYGQARNGPYWRLEFRDAGGSISGKIWSPQSLSYPELTSGVPVWVKGKVTSYRDRLELAIETMRQLDQAESAALDLSLFMASSPFSPTSMLEELSSLCRRELTHKPWRKFALSLLADADIVSRLCLAPAAKSMHHAYAGGLLEHTLSVARLCMRFADHYPQLDRQVLLAGALCHDLGKIWELSSGLTVDYTHEGRLIGHIFLSLEKLAPFIKKSGLEPELAEHLQHLILSHHGTLEFGSPRLPATAEALALHYADNVDAKLQQVYTALAEVEEQNWSSYNAPLERFLLRAKPTPCSALPGRPTTQLPDASTQAEAPVKPNGIVAASGNGAGNCKADAGTAPRQQPLSLFSQCSLLLKE
jgi:3'-5' exoribonuclease